MFASCQVDVTPGPKPVEKIRVHSSRPTQTPILDKSYVHEPLASITLAWDRNPEKDIAGYRVHYGITSGLYPEMQECGDETTATVENLTAGERFFFVVTAYDSDTFESAYSEEISAVAGASPSPTPIETPTVTPTPVPTETPFPTMTPSPTPFVGRLRNISTRGFVNPGDGALIAGFIIGDGQRKIIVRAIGPTLTPFFALVLSNPTLELWAGNNLIAWNNDWRESQEAEVIATGIPPENNLESAIVRTVPLGDYTAIVRGVNNGVGVALVEVYALDP